MAMSTDTIVEIEKRLWETGDTTERETNPPILHSLGKVLLLHYLCQIPSWVLNRTRCVYDLVVKFGVSRWQVRFTVCFIGNHA